VKTLSIVNEVYEQYNRRIPTAELNQFLQEAVKKQPPAAVQGKWIKLYYITQAETGPPKFVIFCNYPKLIQESYRRYLSNRLRERFGFEGVPLELKIKPRNKK
jgi:GTP-binding protein